MSMANDDPSQRDEVAAASDDGAEPAEPPEPGAAPEPEAEPEPEEPPEPEPEQAPEPEAEEAPEPEAEEPPEPEAEGQPEPQPEAPPVTVYGDGTPVVLLHTFALDSRMWIPQLEALSGYQVLVPDLRGFGSAREQALDVVHMDLLADDVARLLDERGLERAVVCGLSMGGDVALAFARRHPDRLGGLVLCATRAGTDSEEEAAARLAMAERVLSEGVDFVAEAMVPLLLGETTRKKRPGLVEQVKGIILDQEPRGIAGAQRGLAARADPAPALAGLTVPTLVIVGEEDLIAGPDEARALATGTRDARLVQVAGAGHLVNMEQPEPVNEALLDFVAPLWI
jgi:pimeloyl-ACP methyl ester carboxylesterase